MIEEQIESDEDITEDIVHKQSKIWLDNQGYTDYKGVCNKNKKYTTKIGKEMPVGSDVPVPHEIFTRMICIDHLAEKIENKDRIRIWIEDKGNVGLSKLLEGYCRLCFAVYHGGGNGLLSIPSEIYDLLVQDTSFLSAFYSSLKENKDMGQIGLLDAKKNRVLWL